jgi:uracil-DNA glycosylase family 4
MTILKEILPACQKCDINITHKVLGLGDLNIATNLVIGLNPGYSSSKTKGHIEIGPFQVNKNKKTGSSVIISKLINDLELDVSMFYFTNLVKCATVQNIKISDPVDRKIIDNCRLFLLAEITSMPNLERIFCLGKIPSTMMGFIENDLFNCYMDWGRVKVASLWHPNHVVRKQSLYDTYLDAWRAFLQIKGDN